MNVPHGILNMNSSFIGLNKQSSCMIDQVLKYINYDINIDVIDRPIISL